MRTSEEALAKIKEFEGCRLYAYRDSGGKLTIGYGHTKGVKSGQAITQKQAEALLKGDLLPNEKFVGNLGLDLTQGQFDALVDFCFNLGTANLYDSTLLKKIRTKASEKEIRAEFARWVYCNGRKLAGLVRRRQWEADRYFE